MAEVKKLPWLKETSERSGFDNFDYHGKKRWVGIKQDGRTIAPEEFDTPPPSTRPLGGADISGSPRQNSLTTDTPLGLNYSIQYITAAGGIRLTNDPWLRVAGSNQTVNISVDPQINLGTQGQYLAVECVGSGILLEEGNGLSLAGSSKFLMGSGGIITFFCDRTSNLWRETSRVINGGI